jgi:hypothetical protein
LEQSDSAFLNRVRNLDPKYRTELLQSRLAQVHSNDPFSHRSKPLSWKFRSAAEDSKRVAAHYPGGSTFRYAGYTTVSGSLPRAASDGSNASDQGLAVFRNGCRGLEGDKRRLG